MLGSQVSVVAGETGSGKTTQVPQFLLDTLLENTQVGVRVCACVWASRLLS